MDVHIQHVQGTTYRFTMTRAGSVVDIREFNAHTPVSVMLGGTRFAASEMMCVSADWPVDFGTARKAGRRVEKALMQCPRAYESERD